MWIQKTKTNKFRYFEGYADPKTGKYKVTSLTLDNNRRADKEAARDALRARIKAICEETATSSNITFGRLCEEYTAAQRHSAKAQTARSNERKNKTLRKLIGDDVLVSQLTAPYVRRSLEADKPTTYNERLKRFKALIRWAYREEYIHDIGFLDKLQRAKTPPPREANAQKYLEKDELKALIDGMKVEAWKQLTRFLALSGLRIGEAMALTDADINFFKREIYVNKTFSLELQKDSTTKTDASARTVYMQDELFECCMQIADRNAKLKELFAIANNTFLQNPDGGRIHYDAYRKYLSENTEKIVGRSLKPHALRHTHVAMLAEAGIPLETISRRLGHADSKITREIYMHVTKQMVEHENELLREVKIV